jgi:hypothetical protein
MPTLFARRYVRQIEQVGNTEKAVGILILLLVAAIVAVFVVQVSTGEAYLFNVDEEVYASAPRSAGDRVAASRPSAVGAGGPFPEPGLEGWRAPDRVDRFAAENLYVKIDGRAEAYLKFHAVGLTFGRYYHRNDAERTVDVYWYDMGTGANALGMYRSEQSPDATPVSIGLEGYRVGGAVFFCEGSSYVQVLPTRLDDADAHAALKIAERLAERIERK